MAVMISDSLIWMELGLFELLDSLTLLRAEFEIGVDWLKLKLYELESMTSWLVRSNEVVEVEWTTSWMI